MQNRDKVTGQFKAHEVAPPDPVPEPEVYVPSDSLFPILKYFAIGALTAVLIAVLLWALGHQPTHLVLR